MQSICGKKPKPVFATKGDASKKIRAGMPIGCKVSIRGEEMYTFLDKLIQCVLPRIREFKGLNPVSNKGVVEMTLPSNAIGTFPDIEPHFDMFPRLFDTKVL
jgi:large subunit ribosomal protein L5